ncbi:hypothetical protein GCM10010431_55690 [Streptomyces kunmingensis]
MSDWDGAHGATNTMYAGNDLIEPGGKRVWRPFSCPPRCRSGPVSSAYESTRFDAQGLT